MTRRESAAAQAESTQHAIHHPQQENSDPLLQRYLGAALFRVLGSPSAKNPPSGRKAQTNRAG